MARADLHASRAGTKPEIGIALDPIRPSIVDSRVSYRHVSLHLDRKSRTAALTMCAPKDAQPDSPDGITAAGCDYWPLRAFRELDHALLHLRFNEPETGLVLIKTEGDAARVLQVDHVLHSFHENWLVREILLLMKRTLKRLELTSHSFFAILEPGSCFVGSLLELALAADRSYALDERNVCIQLSPLNGGSFPMSNGLTRLESRFLTDPGQSVDILERTSPMNAREAEKAGLITVALDDLDFEDEVRMAIEERASLSPDALTGMEASLRFAGPETMETKIFGRLSAWQNWIFSRPNAVGECGALSLYGKPERPSFDWRRT